MAPRVFVATALQAETALDLPAEAARHVQVLRAQPGDALTLFDGHGGEWRASVVRMGRGAVQVQILEHLSHERELPLAVTLAVAMPTNDRMDALVEKATELGAAAIRPLVSERSVLRLAGERALRRQAHWQGIAVAACEQCGRNRIPTIHPVQSLAGWLADLSTAADGEPRLLLGWRESRPWAQAMAAQLGASLTLLSGPEGGFAEVEEDIARARGFVTVSLGPRVLRADTAPLAALAAIALRPP
jgi:16S rRNA (uracil1498-N3)-methyltransferase